MREANERTTSWIRQFSVSKAKYSYQITSLHTNIGLEGPLKETFIFSYVTLTLNQIMYCLELTNWLVAAANSLLNDVIIDRANVVA